MNNHHIITTKRANNGRQLKRLRCNKFSRLKLKKGLMNYAKELADFERIHRYCQPQADGRSLRYTKPTPPTNEAKPYCLICGKEFSEQQGKVPLYNDDKLSPLYAHLGCAGGVDYALFEIKGKEEWLYTFDASKVTDYEIGHHNLVVQSEGEWLYFWQGYMGSARNKAEAIQALAKLRDNHANATTNEGGAIG